MCASGPFDRCPECLQQLFSDGRAQVGITKVLRQYDKFIAAQSCHSIGAASRLSQSLRDRLQYLLADSMSEAIVDAFEII